MKRSMISSVCMLTIGIALVAGGVVTAQSPSSFQHDDVCSNRTLSGDYGAKIEGTLLGPNLPLRTLVLFRFDGHGGLVSFGHPVVNGMPPAEEWGRSEGTYTVNPDCTGSASLEAPPIRFHFVVVNRGRQFYLVVDGNAISGEARKVDGVFGRDDG